ncbi:Uncharacterised protein [Bacillus subtilis]|nr:hypothetical protein S101392_02152 [Bacillus subtilis subsp. subtilis]CON16049.1 Uncharacterised protein [Bacillus subtilis]
MKIVSQEIQDLSIFRVNFQMLIKARQKKVQTQLLSKRD